MFMKGIIYKATNLYNGLSYIGQTRRSLKARMDQHFYESKIPGSVNHFHHALVQYGKAAFEWTILDEFSGNKEDVIHALNVAEEYHILKNRTFLDDYGYNSTKGGYSSDVFAEAIKRRAKSSGRYKAILQYDLDGNFIKEYESMSAAREALGGKGSGCFIGKMWMGFQWMEKEDADFPKKIEPYRGAEPRRGVIVYKASGEFYREFDNAYQCFMELGKRYKVRGCDLALSHSVSNKDEYLVFRKKAGRYPKKIVVELNSTKKNADTPVLQYDKKGKFIKEYPSISSARRRTGVSEACIRKWCNTQPPFSARHLRTRWIWRYKNGDIEESLEMLGIRKRNLVPNPEHMVVQYDARGQIIKVWDNMSKAARQTGESYALIRKQCLGERTKKKTASIWKYYTPDYPKSIEVA